MKRRVTGIGGVFFKARDPENMKSWYQKHLDINSGPYGAVFHWRDREYPQQEGHTAWSLFPEDTDYYHPSKKDFMINYRVEDLETLLAVLQEEGVEVIGKIEKYSYGKFGWILDPEGNKIELWEPLDENTL